MNRLYLLVICSVCLAFVPLELSAQKLQLANGNLDYVDSRGTVIPVDHSGHVVEAAMSPDGHKIAALGEPGERKAVSEYSGIEIFRVLPEQVKSIYRAKGEIQAGELRSVQFLRDIKWANDSSVLYVLTDFSDTSFYLVGIDPEAGKVKAITPALTYCIVESGEYKDHVIAQVRKSTLVGLWVWFWLFSPNGKEIGPIGDERYLSDFCRNACRASCRS